MDTDRFCMSFSILTDFTQQRVLKGIKMNMNEMAIHPATKIPVKTK